MCPLFFKKKKNMICSDICFRRCSDPGGRQEKKKKKEEWVTYLSVFYCINVSSCWQSGHFLKLLFLERCDVWAFLTLFDNTDVEQGPIS